MPQHVVFQVALRVEALPAILLRTNERLLAPMDAHVHREVLPHAEHFAAVRIATTVRFRPRMQMAVLFQAGFPRENLRTSFMRTFELFLDPCHFLLLLACLAFLIFLRLRVRVRLAGSIHWRLLFFQDGWLRQASLPSSSLARIWLDFLLHVSQRGDELRREPAAFQWTDRDSGLGLVSLSSRRL